MAKITAPLAATIEAADPDEDVVVVVEMTPNGPTESVAPQQRQRQIAALRMTFEKQASPIERTIHDVGGEVLDRAWINNTMKARLPARAIKELLDIDGVKSVDVEHRLHRD